MSDDPIVLPAKKPRYRPGSRKGKGGKPSKVKDLFDKPMVLNLIAHLVKENKSDSEIARIINVPKTSFLRWKKSNAEYWPDASPNSELSWTQRAEIALKKKIDGHWVERPIYDHEGNLIDTKFQFYPPSDTAIQYVLNNKAPAEWKQKVEHNHAMEELPIAINFSRATPLIENKQVKAITDDYGNSVIVDANERDSKP